MMNKRDTLDTMNGHPLRVERCRRNMTQAELADVVKVGVTTIWRAENDYPISATSRQRICTYFDMTSQELGLAGKKQRKVSALFSYEAGITPTTKEASFVLTKRHQLLDTFFEHVFDDKPEPQIGAWLALESCNIASLFDAGWTLDAILNSLRIVLQSVESMPMMTRRKLLHLSGMALISGLAVSDEKHISAEEQVQFHHALAKSIADGWKCFHTGENAQVLITGQALLHLAQEYYSSLYSTETPVLYSPTYLLVTAGYYFQGHYGHALHSSKKAYIAALEACDTWNMAESLSWQGGVWKACGQQEKAIQATEAALQLVKDSNNPLARVTQARLYAHWAESAALQQQPIIADTMLDASASLLNSIEPNAEFDISTWHYYRGTCAFYLGNMTQADIYFQQVLQNYPQNSIQQHVTSLLFQAKVRLNRGDREGSLVAARSALPLLAKIKAPLLSWGFMDYLQGMQAKFLSSPEIESIVSETRKMLALPADRTVSRYLEGKL